MGGREGEASKIHVVFEEHMMTTKDQALAQRALRKPCRQHPKHKAATCPECYALAEEESERHWTRVRKAKHKLYLIRLGA